MSRVAKKPIEVPAGVNIEVAGNIYTAKGPKGTMQSAVNPKVTAKFEDNQIQFAPVDNSRDGWAHAGTARALVSNIITGVTSGFEKKLELVGVGYRAQAKGQVLNLSLGFSHPVVFDVPEGVQVETPSQTEVVIRGVDKQLVGQVAANIRAFRPPEPYKGKGVKYADERIIRKEAKKK